MGARPVGRGGPGVRGPDDRVPTDVFGDRLVPLIVPSIVLPPVRRGTGAGLALATREFPGESWRRMVDEWG